MYKYHLILYKKVGWFNKKRVEAARRISNDLSELLEFAPSMLKSEELFGEYTNDDLDLWSGWDF
jgi:hypothetical protein